MKRFLLTIFSLGVICSAVAQSVHGKWKGQSAKGAPRSVLTLSKPAARARVYDLLGKAAAYGPQPRDPVQLEAALSLFDKAISLSDEYQLSQEHYTASMNKSEVLLITGKLAALKQMLSQGGDSLRAEIARQISRYYNDAHYEPRDFQKAKEYGELSLRISETMNDPLRMINAHNQLGFTYVIERQFKESEQHFLQVVQLDQKVRSDNLGFAYFYLIRLSDREGYLNRAVALGLDALRYLERPGIDNYGFAIFEMLGNIYAQLGEYDKGLALLDRARKEALAKDQPESYWHTITSIAEVQLKLGKAAEALKTLDETASLHPPVLTAARVFVLTKRGKCLMALGRYDDARDDLLRASHLNDDPAISPSIDKGLAELYLLTRQWDLSRSYLEKILTAPNTWTAANIATVHLLAYKVDSAQGRFEDALSHLQKGKALNDSINALARLRQIEELKLQYQTEKIFQDVQLKQQKILLLENQRELERKRFNEKELKFLLEDKEKENHLLTLNAQTAEKDKRILVNNQSITNLQTEGANRQIRLDNANLIRNITIGGMLLLILLLVVLYRQFRSTQRATKMLGVKSVALEQTVAEKEKLIREKDWLLKEVHHRVKNNLQTVVSLLESQSANLDLHALEANLDSRNRVYAMSLVHQKLYQSEKVASIQMDSYLTELIQYLKESMDVRNIYFRLELTPLSLDVAQAISVGLIVNEAITNAIKHAFPDPVKQPVIEISMMHVGNGNICLLIRDNGVGLPPGFIEEKRTSLGLKLMEGLTGDIMGAFDIHTSNGTVISITFPPEEMIAEVGYLKP